MVPSMPQSIHSEAKGRVPVRRAPLSGQTTDIRIHSQPCDAWRKSNSDIAQSGDDRGPWCCMHHMQSRQVGMSYTLLGSTRAA